MILVVIIIVAILLDLAANPASWFGPATTAVEFTFRHVIALAVLLHIFEEHVAGFADYFNYEVMRSPAVDRPIGRIEAALKDKIGLAVVLVALVLFSPAHPWALSVALGFIAADAVQHVAISVRTRSVYTPGVATAVLAYLPAICIGFACASVSWLAFTAGAAALLGNYLFARVRTPAA